MANLYTTKTDGIDIVYAADVNELQAGVGFAHMPGGRLTLETGVPISTTDQSAKTTLYYTPYYHNRIPLYSGSAWQLVNFTSDLSITLVGTTASLPYDVFCYNNSGTATLELTAWTNTTTRATALTRQDGRYVKTGATTRLYLGTIYINGTGGQTDDTNNKRFVYNAYNRVNRKLFTYNSTASWTYSTGAWREYNNGTGQVRGEFVTGLLGHNLLNAILGYSITGTSSMYIGLAVNSTSSASTYRRQITNGVTSEENTNEYLTGINLLSIGYNYITQIEFYLSGTPTIAGTTTRSGIVTLEM